MIEMYCRHHHSATGLCEDCSELYDYAEKRILECRYGFEKPACSECPVHCYKPEYRERIRRLMRYSGPRMMLRHPYYAVMHLIDKRKFK